MSTQSHLYTHAKWLAPRTPATPDEAQAIHRLATAAQVNAVEYGVEITWREAIARARENLRDVMQMARERGVRV